MYADDTTIYFNLEDFDSNNLEIKINAELHKVSMWLKNNKLSLNLESGTTIECVQYFNFLGIILSKNISWTNHVLSIKKKISKVIGMNE